ncbi:MAG: hypothetical protein H7210_13925 [Pyrinomonadaceae bacterium]|nr:hypothetical protein [Phycisphaerales bacterium]
MLPLIEAAAGEMGENMQVFYFEGKSKDGKALIDPTREGFLQVKLGERTVRFRLPLASLMPEKKCPTCAEMLSGSWKFCPWDGASLKAEEKAK